MLDQEALSQLARIAHGLWCERMVRDGWKPGAAYCAQSRTHDALVPFEQLAAQDRKHAGLGIEAQELERPLLAAIDYQRGPDREFTVQELRPGLAVGLIDPKRPSGRARFTGIVEKWETDATGELVIHVKWEGGERSEHLACARELVRVTA